MDDEENEPLHTASKYSPSAGYGQYTGSGAQRDPYRDNNYREQHQQRRDQTAINMNPQHRSNQYQRTQSHDVSANADQNWPGETQTFISATTDMSHFSQDNLARFPKDRLSRISCDPQFVSTIVASVIVYITPIIFIIIPWISGQKACLSATENQIESVTKAVTECDTEMQSNILAVAIKLLILSVASYWIFWQKSRVIYPRTHWPRVLSLGIMAFTTAVYWLFYAVNIIQKKGKPETAVKFAGHVVDTLLYIHVVAIIVIETRVRSPNSEKMFLCEVLRSTDGEQRFYNFNRMTIQEMAYQILCRYYVDFPLNNPAALLVGGHSQKRKQARDLNDSTTQNNTQANINISNKDFKVYNVDAKGSNTDNDTIVEQSKQVIAAATAKKRENAHAANERYYDSLEWERHCRKRKSRLECSAEDAFSHVNRHESHTSRKSLRRQLDKNGDRFPPNIMDAQEAATVLFPSVARPLQKYLRTTRQHLHYSLSNTTQHLADSLKYGISYRAFLKRYFAPRPQLGYPSQANIHDTSDGYLAKESVEWTISSEASLTSNITESTVFLLGTQDFSLLVQCYEHPSIQLTETFPDNRCRFTLKINTTSV